MTRYGVTVPLHGVPLPEHAAPLARLREAGFDQCWTQEVRGHDALVPLAAIAAQAPRAGLGASIAGVFTRGPALLAMQAAAVAEAAPGRFALGIGSSSPAIVEGWNGLAFERPLARVRDTLRFLRRALAGERVSGPFESFEIAGFRLDRPPAVPPPLLVGALRERMLRLAGAEADGVCLSLLGAEDVPRVASVVRDAAGGAGREVVLRVAVLATADRERARGLARRILGPYLNQEPYARFHAWLGRGDALSASARAWRAGDRAGAGAAVPDAVVDALVVHGPPEACREHLARFAAAGVTTLVADVLAGDGDPADVYASLCPER